MDVHVIPQLSDNYGYLIVDTATKTAAVVDPVEAGKCVAAAKALGVAISTVLTTHSHWDHAGGNDDIAKMLPAAQIVGGAGDSIPAVTQEVAGGEELELGTGVTIRTLSTPCHTPGHVSYLAEPRKGGEGAVFTGDTMFVGGCGNFNSGTAQQMYTALVEKLGKLPPATKVYVGHEYTEKNLRFAASVEPTNADIADKLTWVREQRKAGKQTVPSTIGSEWKTNPFMRVAEPGVQAYTGKKDPVAVLAEVRKQKTVWGRTN